MKEINPAILDLFSLLCVKGVGPAKIHSLWKVSGESYRSFTEFMSKGTSLEKYLKSNQLSDFDEIRDKSIEQFSQLMEDDVVIIDYFSEEYPRRLKNILWEKAPLFLMVKGNISLLNKKSVGFCGSRKASDKGISTASDCTELLAEQGININSGYASGIDMATHRTALSAGGTTTIVLPEGINQFRIKKQIEESWDWDRVCVVSEFLPDLPWSVRNAMQRNNTIIALSKVMILIEAGATGGSIAAGKKSLEVGVPLLAPVYEGLPESAIGNRQLLEQGAFRLHKSKSTGRAHLDWVFDVVNRTDEAQQLDNKVESEEQLGLFRK